MRFFISYSRNDKNEVWRIADILRAAGHETFSDTDIEAGENWSNVIQQSIESADALIYVISIHSVLSAMVKAEYSTAIASQKPIIPILLNKIEIPEIMKNYQYVDFSDGITSSAIAKFVAGISFISSRQEPEEFLKVPATQTIYTEGLPSNMVVNGTTIEIEKQLDKTTKQYESEINQLNSESIFISYKRDDWDIFVRPLIEDMRNAGLTVWVDQHLLEGGQDWMDEINKALKTCTKMVLCVSPESLESMYVKMEYRFFFHKRKQIIPLICQEAELPAELLGIQSIPYSQTDDLLDRLKQT